MNLTAIVLTRNEEENIVDCLESVSFADEIIIIDDNSTDRTVDLARQFTKQIHTRSLQKNFSSQRNFALNLAHGKWILFVDADERVGENLKKEIIRVTKTEGRANGYFIHRVDTMWGKTLRHGEVSNINILRLGRKGFGKWKGRIHEKWKISGRKETLLSSLVHKPHPKVADFIKEIDLYTEVRAAELLEEGKKAGALSIIVYPFGKFVFTYFIKRGYKDGIAGFLYSSLMSLHSFLVRSKVYLKLHEG